MALGAKVAAIEIDGDNVRLAVIKTGKLPAVLELVSTRATYETPEERNGALLQAVDEALGLLKSKPAACVLCASSQYSIVRQLSVPFRGQRRVAAAVPFELEPHLAFPLEDLLLDFSTIAEVNGETEVLAIGMRRNYLEEQRELLEQCGVEVEAVNVDAIGLTSLWHAQRRQQKGLNAVLHVRSGSSSLAITYNKSLAYIRPLSLNVSQLLEAPAVAAREIQNTLRAFLAKWRGQGEINALHLTGINLREEDRAALSEALRLPVEDGVMLEGLKGAAQALAEHGEPDGPNLWEPAIGVAASAAGLGFGLDFARSGRSWRSGARGIITHVMFSSCLVLLILLGVAFYFQQAASAGNFEAATLQQEIDALTKEVEDLSTEGLGEGIDVEYFEDPPMLDVLKEISEKLPGDKVTITEIVMKPAGFRSAWLTVKGESSSAAMVSEVFANLQTSTLVKATEAPTINVANGKTNFEIRLDRPQAEETADEANAA